MTTYEFFKFVTDLDDLKSQYRQLCKQHHPDLGGDVEVMKKINAEYSQRLTSGIFNAEFEEKNTNSDIEEALRDVIEKTCCLQGLIIEICGRWVWFTGATYEFKTYLKEIGCFFSGKKKAWYWRPADEKKRRFGKTLELDEIRSKYGSKSVSMKHHEGIA